jgi:hypothetical protein
MLYTGYALQLRIRTLKVEVDSYATQFENGKARFDDEDKPSSLEAFENFKRAEEELATAQTLQCMYNQRVHVTVQGVRMTLAKAIRLVGGAGRAESMWRNVVAPKKERYHARDDLVRTKDQTYAFPTYTREQAQVKAKQTAAYAAALRQAIQEANATQIELDPSAV